MNSLSHECDVFSSHWFICFYRGGLWWHNTEIQSVLLGLHCHVTLEWVQSSTLPNEKKWVNIKLLFSLMCSDVCNVLAWSRNAFSYPIPSCNEGSTFRLFLITSQTRHNVGVYRCVECRMHSLGAALVIYLRDRVRSSWSCSKIIPLFSETISAKDQNTPPREARQSWSYWFSRDFSSLPPIITPLLLSASCISLSFRVDLTALLSHAPSKPNPRCDYHIMLLPYYQNGTALAFVVAKDWWAWA